MMTPENIVAEARRHQGAPFLHQGRDPRIGLDCIGLVFVVAWALGFALGFDFSAYASSPDGETLRRELAARLTEVPLGDLQDGDVILFKIRRDPQHVGIATTVEGTRSVIHTRRGSVDGVTEHPLAEEWRSKIVTVFRFPQHA